MPDKGKTRPNKGRSLTVTTLLSRFLGPGLIDIRLGGIYALQRLMQDSPRDQSTVIAVLCAFVRDSTTPTRKPHKPPTIGPLTGRRWGPRGPLGVGVAGDDVDGLWFFVGRAPVLWVRLRDPAPVVGGAAGWAGRGAGGPR